jgi:hypothetical protein
LKKFSGHIPRYIFAIFIYFHDETSELKPGFTKRFRKFLVDEPS